MLPPGPAFRTHAPNEASPLTGTGSRLGVVMSRAPQLPPYARPGLNANPGVGPGLVIDSGLHDRDTGAPDWLRSTSCWKAPMALKDRGVQPERRLLGSHGPEGTPTHADRRRTCSVLAPDHCFVASHPPPWTLQKRCEKIPWRLQHQGADRRCTAPACTRRHSAYASGAVYDPPGASGPGRWRSWSLGLTTTFSRYWPGTGPAGPMRSHAG